MKGRRINPEVKKAVISDYFLGEKTIDQICSEYDIKRRTIYGFKEIKNHKWRLLHNPRQMRRAIRISLDEAELILLMISECEKIIKGKNERGIMRSLENRVLEIADILYEIKSLEHI